MKKNRRDFLKLSGSALAASSLVSAPAVAQTGPVRIGVLAARSGVLASIGECALITVQWWADRVNASGGILGRKLELVVEEEGNAKDTSERFRKLALRDNVEMITGIISTGNGLSVGPISEELKMIWMSWDGTTQKDVTETIPNPKYAFRSTDNEVEGLMASLLTVKHYKGKIKTVANLGTDYSYGRNMWDTFTAMMKKYDMNVTPVADLWVKVGSTDVASFVATLQQAKPDLIMSSLLFTDAFIFMKQAHAAGLTQNSKLVMPAAGFQVNELKKEFTPEGMILGHNSMYFDPPNPPPLLKEFVKFYHDKTKLFPHFEAERAYSAAESWKQGVEKAAKENGGKWPSKEAIAKALEGISIDSLGGYFAWRPDHIPDCNYYMGFTTHKNPYDIVTIDPVITLDTREYQKPSGADFYKWIEEKQFKML
ncbi:MAG TPA: ABC transporter substrate-binding protein [Xanthobacteraceae bacterium]|jgi:branched-chain amino acid transport system substrate-binding protein